MESPVEPAVLLSALYAICRIEREREISMAMEVALFELEKELRADNVSYVNEFLSKGDPAKLDPAVTLVILTITYWGKDRLPDRPEFLARAEVALVEKLGQERAEHLLVNRR